MTRINDNSLRMEPKQVLEQLPLWSDLKHVADNNNYRDDKAQREDKVLRGVQQKLLGLMRIYPVLHTYVMDDDLQVLSQQFWGLLCQFEKTVMEQRKQSSIPGSLPVENPLFTAEDLKVAKAREAVNRTSSMFASAEHSSMLCLCHTTAFRGYKFKPKGGKGFGKPSGYTKYYPSSSYKGSWKGRGKGQASGKPFSAATAEPDCIHSDSQGHGHQGLHCETRPAPVQIDKPGYGFRLGTEGGASLHEVEAEPPVVEAACNTLDPKSGFAWHICTMGGRPSLVNSVQDKASFRHSVGRVHPARLQISGCSEGGFNGGNKTSYPLVHNFKGRTHWHKTQVNFRLQGNKSIFGDPKICLRQYPKYSPFFAKRPMGRKDRLKGCLFSPGGTPKTKTIFENASWRKNLGVSGWMFWPKYYATTFHAVNENISDQVEEKWHPGFCVLGRHFGPRNIQKSFGKSFRDSDTGFGVSRIQNKPEKECPTTMPRGNSFGFQPQPERRLFTARPLKVKNCQEGTWKNCSSQENFNQKNGSHFGQCQELFSGPPLFKSFHRSTVQVCAARGTGRLELSPPHPPLLKDQLKEVKHLLTSWEGRLFTTNHTRELFSDSSDLAWGGWTKAVEK